MCIYIYIYIYIYSYYILKIIIHNNTLNKYKIHARKKRLRIDDAKPKPGAEVSEKRQSEDG